MKTQIILSIILTSLLVGAVGGKLLLSQMTPDEVNKLTDRQVTQLAIEEANYWKAQFVRMNMSLENYKRIVSNEYMPQSQCGCATYSCPVQSCPSQTIAITCHGSDINNDGLVNSNDLIILQNNFGNSCSSPDWCDCSDINKDGAVDSGDYLQLKGDFS